MADPASSREASDQEKRCEYGWRVGRKVGYTLYDQLGPEPSDDDRFIGSCVSEFDALALVEAANDATPAHPVSEADERFRRGVEELRDKLRDEPRKWLGPPAVVHALDRLLDPASSPEAVSELDEVERCPTCGGEHWRCLNQGPIYAHVHGHFNARAWPDHECCPDPFHDADPAPPSPAVSEGAGDERSRVIERVSGNAYEVTGEFRIPDPNDDYLDPKTGNVYGGGHTGARQIILRRVGPASQVSEGGSRRDV